MRMGHVGEQKPCENGVFEYENVHVGKQKPLENGVFENENVDINKDVAFQGCWNPKIVQRHTNFDENEIFP